MCLRSAVALLIPVLMLSVIPAYALNDEFTSFDSSVWEPAGGWPISAYTTPYEGAPQTSYNTVLGDKSVLVMRSDLSSNQKRGYRTTESYGPYRCFATVDFMPMEGANSAFGCLLTIPNTGMSLGIGIHDDAGARSVSARNSWGGVWTAPGNDVWQYNNWYRFVLDMDEMYTRVSLRDTQGSVIWSYRHLIGLADMDNTVNVYLAQSTGNVASAYSVVAIDRVSVVPEPGSLSVLGLGFGALITMIPRRRRSLSH